MLFLHSLRGNGSVTFKGVVGMSFCEIEDNKFGIIPSTDGHSPIKIMLCSSICTVLYYASFTCSPVDVCPKSSLLVVNLFGGGLAFCVSGDTPTMALVSLVRFSEDLGRND